MPPFKGIEEQVEQYLTRKAQQDLVLKLRKNAKIKRHRQACRGEAAAGEAGAAGAGRTEAVRRLTPHALHPRKLRQRLFEFSHVLAPERHPGYFANMRPG